MTEKRVYSAYTTEAALLLGAAIKLGRKQKKWSEKDLAERAGISRATLQKIEQGDLRCAMGLVFETAALVNVKLFETDDTRSVATLRQNINEKVALIPKPVTLNKATLKDDF